MRTSFARWPLPAVHDEFANLLAADTFAHGRLANPPHPFWEHFESFHIIQQPTYASKYPPGQGLLLAIGQVATGWPIAGVWLQTALAAIAIYWMLLGWTSPRWSAIGGVLYLMHPGYQLQWGQTYWGGTLALIGGALVFGAALRMTQQFCIGDAVAMATGAVVLAATRPFEGLIFCVLVGCWVLAGWRRIGLPGPLAELVAKLVIPHAVVLLLGITSLLAYNKAVTGHVLTMPYQVHHQTYGQAPLFLGQPVATNRTYRHSAIAQFHGGWELDWARRQETLPGLIKTKWKMIAYDASFFVPGLLALPVVAMFLTRRPRRWNRVAAPTILGIGTLAATLVSVWNFPHYTAAVAPLLILLVVASLQHVEALGRRFLRLRGVSLVLIVVQACIFAAIAVNHAAMAQGWSLERLTIELQLKQRGGKHLVFVRYARDHNPRAEWVYNGADIDDAAVVWAREIDSERDAALMHYFRDRTAWLLEPDARRLRPLPIHAQRKSSDTSRRQPASAL